MRHIYRCPLRWSDMDAYGHVNNAIFLRYLEEARIDFTSLRGAESKQGSVVARHEIDYRRQLTHRPTPVDIELWVTEIRAASFTVSYEVKDPDVIYVQARTVVVPFDFEAQRPRRITAEEREFLQRYTDNADDTADEEAVAA
ncbi:acyl-CoA thioesterase [Streptomyces alanosinicus]|uniref:Thioesterase n=1 Tax=Streptomyces alanosinicus TaxID=68171 RepID=A0A918YD64_9ACTN|nr:thioesterase family protein [Streptomyces alanosinicus]GHD99089.1 thioesterase [Streptomyces alanosinicus]